MHVVLSALARRYARAVVLATFLLSAAMLAGEPEGGVFVPPWPMLVTSFGGGGAVMGEGLTLGGDVMLGMSIRSDSSGPKLVVQPVAGWSGWRGFDRVDPYTANAFVGRLDMGVLCQDCAAPMGFAISGAGRIGTARIDGVRSRARGGHAGVVWWLYHDVFALELQLHINEIGREWSHDDLRLVTSINLSSLISTVLWGGF